MSRNYYSEINLHIVWHTNGSSPLLTPTLTPIVYRELRGASTIHPAHSFIKLAALRRTCIWRSRFHRH